MKRSTRNRAVAALAAALLVLPAAAAGAPAAAGHAGAVRCGRISYNTKKTTLVYTVRIDRGTIGCGPAKTMLRKYLARGKMPSGWFCVRGHASQSQPWAAACAATGQNVKAFKVKTV